MGFRSKVGSPPHPTGGYDGKADAPCGVCVCVCDVINKLLNKKGSSLLKSETKYLFQGNFCAEEAQVESSVGSVA